MLTGYEMGLLAAVPAYAEPALSEDVSVEALVRDFESELVALRQRATLRLLRAEADRHLTSGTATSARQAQ